MPHRVSHSQTSIELNVQGFQSKIENTPQGDEGDINMTAFPAFGRSYNTTPPDRGREQLAPARVQERTYDYSNSSWLLAMMANARYWCAIAPILPLEA